jgi:hypothetical protein
MVIILTCSCGKHLQIGDDYAGERGLCPACGAYRSIPAPADAPAVLLEEGEIALPLLLAAPENQPPAEPGPADEPPVEIVAAVKEPALGSPPALPPEPGPEPLIPAALGGISLPAVPMLTITETVVVEPLPLTALAPPEKDELDFGERRDTALPRYGIFPPRSVYVATLLGGFLAGTIVLACNYQTLRRRRAMRLTAATGILAAGLFLAALFVYPQFRETPWQRLSLYALAAPLWVAVSPGFNFIERCSVVVPAFAMGWLAWLVQGRAYRDYLGQGGKRASVWTAAGMSLFCAVVPFVGISLHYGFHSRREPIGALVVQGYAVGRREDPWGAPRMSDVYFQEGVSKRDASRLADFLAAHDPRIAPGRVKSRMMASGDGFIISFVVPEDLWNDPEVSEKLRALVPDLSAALHDRPIRVELCNDEFTRRRPLP